MSNEWLISIKHQSVVKGVAVSCSDWLVYSVRKKSLFWKSVYVILFCSSHSDIVNGQILSYSNLGQRWQEGVNNLFCWKTYDSPQHNAAWLAVPALPIPGQVPGAPCYIWEKGALGGLGAPWSYCWQTCKSKHGGAPKNSKKEKDSWRSLMLERIKLAFKSSLPDPVRKNKYFNTKHKSRRELEHQITSLWSISFQPSPLSLFSFVIEVLQEFFHLKLLFFTPVQLP